MLHLCGFVVLSAALLSVADAAGITAGLRALLAPLSARLGWPETAASGLLSGLLEVSCGCAEAAACRAAAPLLLGMILGSMAESNFGRSMLLNKTIGGMFKDMLTRPICIVLIAAIVVTLAIPSIQEMLRARKQKNAEKTSEK